MVRIAVVGSRDFKSRSLVEFIVKRMFRPGDELISGGARGVDDWAAAWARGRGFPVEEIRPDWEKYGRGAGMIRNTEIVKNCDLLIAFWDGKSRGTKDSYDKAQRLGKITLLIVWDGLHDYNGG